jgi:hypothetical protein
MTNAPAINALITDDIGAKPLGNSLANTRLLPLVELEHYPVTRQARLPVTVLRVIKIEESKLKFSRLKSLVIVNFAPSHWSFFGNVAGAS